MIPYAIDGVDIDKATCATGASLDEGKSLPQAEMEDLLHKVDVGTRRDGEAPLDETSATQDFDPDYSPDLEPDSPSEDFDSSDYGDCRVTFFYEGDGGIAKVWHEDFYPYGTPFSEVSETPDKEGYPIRTDGYWVFSGWSPTFSPAPTTLTYDISYRAIFEVAPIQIDIDANGADNNIPSTPMECVWGAAFPDVAVPQKQGSTFSGMYLRMNNGRVVARTHDSEGHGIAHANYSEMGGGTTDSNTPVYIPSCNLTVMWQEPIKWNTLSDIRDTIGNIPVPFADDISATTHIPPDSGADASQISYRVGFPDAYTVPVIDPATGDINREARVITRRQVNTLGNIGTQAQFFEQCGGYYTFDEEICNAIGGYPQTAILKFYEESTNSLRTVYSLVDNNTWNFLTDGVDGVHWKYIDDNPCLTLKVDYSDFIDLKDTLFVETGLPDFYELPYDGMLNIHSFSFCYQQSDVRDHSEFMLAITDVVVDADSGEYVALTERVPGEFGAGFAGATFLDIYNEKTNTTNSIQIRVDGSCNLQVSKWIENAGIGAFYCYKSPRYVVTQGSFFLNKGDKIRVRGTYTSKPWDSLTSKSLNNRNVFGRVYSDMEVRRHYLCKFANFYRTGWL